MTDRPLTLMAVHAHPDDEATSTGGVLAKYAAEGMRPSWSPAPTASSGTAAASKPGQEEHKADDVVALRALELADSCAILGVTHLHMLGYRDSGMMGSDQNDEARSPSSRTA